ncbi:hypothetical protein [uncultured Xanthomonas sp.]|uniref:hypothetical protein n=1 Tax=uncultured Xanthomonas sp. TaxID=152831 RepID=UPI0025F63547|nr:hypothetical protein [uncultured Xanthomonas sp.]
MRRLSFYGAIAAARDGARAGAPFTVRVDDRGRCGELCGAALVIAEVPSYCRGMLARLSMLLLTALLALSAIRAGSAAAAAPAAPAALCASACASDVDADRDGLPPELDAPAADPDPHDAPLAVAPALFPPALLIGPVLAARAAAPRRSYRRPALRPPSRT